MTKHRIRFPARWILPLMLATGSCQGLIEVGDDGGTVGRLDAGAGGDDGIAEKDAGADPADGAGPSDDTGPSDGTGPSDDTGPADDADPADLGEVEWLGYAEQNSRSDGSWGDVLTDIVRHCPPEWVDTYYDSDKVTHGHETSHGIHAYLRNNFNDTGERANGFYVLDGLAAIVAEPGIRKHEVAPYVPQVLRGPRFSTYITGQSAWDDTPLYVWDEWNSYTNGTAVAVDLEMAGRWSYGWRDACMGTIEFVVYAIAVAMAVEELDAGYYASTGQFLAFLKWNLERSMRLYRQCAVLPPFAWDDQDAYHRELRTSPQAAGLRDYVKRTFGETWATEVLQIE